MAQGPLIIVSGPSGCGKSTLIHGVLQRHPDRLRLAVSATTRPKREGEVDGQHYYFWTQEQFERGLAEGKFLEHARVHGVHYYGTLHSEVDDYRDRGMGVFLDIDVVGADRVRWQSPDHVSIFIKLRAFYLYCERLRLRGSENMESLCRRLKTAEEELKRIGEYQHVIVNDDRQQAIDELDVLVKQALARHSTD